MVDKTELTPAEAARAFVANRDRGIAIHDIAFLFGVNQGRVSEDITIIEFALNNRDMIYKMATEAKRT